MKVRKKGRIVFWSAALLASAPTIFAAPTSSVIHTPAPGSAERTAILEALRKPISKSDGKRVTFTHVDLKASLRWAYVESVTVDAKGKQVGTPFSNEVSALLHKTDGKWSVAEWAYATDEISLDWEKKYPRVPRKLWPHRR